jgi:hypothetical protein
MENIKSYLQILVWLIHTKVQVCIKEYQTLPFFDGIFATDFGQLANVHNFIKNVGYNYEASLSDSNIFLILANVSSSS